MIFLSTSASIEINVEDSLSAKDLHFLRQRLEEAFNELAPTILEDLGIMTENSRVVHIEEIEVDDDNDAYIPSPTD